MTHRRYPHPPTPSHPQSHRPARSNTLDIIYLTVNNIARRRQPLSIEYEQQLRLMIRQAKSSESENVYGADAASNGA
jgi:hypothetical protein